jgi:hypothetical protein
VEVAPAAWRGSKRVINLYNIGGISWSSTSALAGADDIGLVRLAAGSLGVTNSTAANLFGSVTANGFLLPTNGIPANPVAGRSYSTNGADAVTLGAFASVPTDSITTTYITASNSSATAWTFTGPAGTVGPDGSKPAAFVVPATSEVVIGAFHNAQRSTNMFVMFQTNRTEVITGVLSSGSAQALQSTVPTNITSIALTPGDWILSGGCRFPHGAGAVSTQSIVSYSFFSNVTTVDGYEQYALPATGVVVAGATCISRPLTLTTNATIYLVGSSSFSGGDVSVHGAITAWRLK